MSKTTQGKEYGYVGAEDANKIIDLAYELAQKYNDDANTMATAILGSAFVAITAVSDITKEQCCDLIGYMVDLRQETKAIVSKATQESKS